MQHAMMRRLGLGAVAVCLLALAAQPATGRDYWNDETPAQRDRRMAWWREARFGMFIHWGLYAVPAGHWKGKPVKGIGEWIMNRAHIQVADYEPLVKQFNPVKFNAERWVGLAKRAGMKYIVITSKHHDGFCLWPSDLTDYDIASTPFKRDILGELTAACKKLGVRMCFYHSIMDWHHPDYLPRRPWEKDTRPADGADFNRYVAYLKGQLRELISRYDPSVLWFDGEWEKTWTHDRGKDLYQYVRQLKPDIIINNRVDKGRGGMKGMSKDRESRGDFGTPEQQIPANGLPGVDWESCMTMNRTWGYKSDDHNWKSTRTLVRNLVDIASKGGNYLLNVGPKADGTFPQASIDRLEQIGKWMAVNGQAIHGTRASAIGKPAWGRCTQKTMPDGTRRLYLHVFDWPADGRLTVTGLADAAKARSASLLAQPDRHLPIRPATTGLVITLPDKPVDPICTVIAVDLPAQSTKR